MICYLLKFIRAYLGSFKVNGLFILLNEGWLILLHLKQSLLPSVWAGKMVLRFWSQVGSSEIGLQWATKHRKQNKKSLSWKKIQIFLCLVNTIWLIWSRIQHYKIELVIEVNPQVSHEPDAFRQTMQKYMIRQDQLSAKGSHDEILTKKGTYRVSGWYTTLCNTCCSSL